MIGASQLAPENPNPAIQTRTIESTVTVQSNDTLVLGGLIQETKGYTETGIPFLKDMPVLGGLFREQDG